MTGEKKKIFKPRRNYCISCEGVHEAIRFLRKVAKDEGPVLLLTSVHPNKLREDYRLEGVDTIWITEEPSKEIKSVAPGRMKFEMSKEILGFISSHERGIIFLEGLEFLIQINGFDEVLKFIKQILDKASGRGITTIVSINPRSIPESQFMMLKDRFDDSGRVDEFRVPGEPEEEIPYLPEIPIKKPGDASQKQTPQEPDSEKPGEGDGENKPQEKKEETSKTKRVPLGVPGFDALIEGGIPRGNAVLLQGPPGVERDTFWMEFIANRLKDDESVIVTLSSTSPDEFREKVKGFGVEIQKYEDDGRVIIIDWYSHRNERIMGIEERGAVYRCSKGLTNLEIALTKGLRLLSDRGRKVCAVIDVLSPAITVLKFDPVYKFAQTLRAKLRKYGVTSLFLLDRGTHEKEEVASLHQIFDGVIDIERERIGSKIERRVAILSMEGTYFESEYYPLGLTKEKGIHVIHEKPEEPVSEKERPPEVSEGAGPVRKPEVITQKEEKVSPVSEEKVEVSKVEVKPEVKGERRPMEIPEIPRVHPRVSEMNGKKRAGFVNGRRRPGEKKYPLYPGKRRQRVFAAVLVICLLSLSVMGVLMIFSPASHGVVIDGETGDWGSAIVYDEGRDITIPAGADIVKYATQADGVSRYFLIGMGSNPFPSGNTTASLLIMIDADGRSDTGYAMKNLGVDTLILITGWDGSVKSASILRYSGGTDRRNWSAFEFASSTSAANSDGNIEVGITNDGIKDSQAMWSVVYRSSTANDAGKVIPGMEGKGALLVEQSPSNRSTVSGKENVLTLRCSAFGKGVDVEEIKVSSNGAVTQIPSFHLDAGRSVTRGVEIDVTSIGAGTYVHASVSEVVSDGYPTITGDDFRGYAKGLPAEVLVDGAMGEWSNPAIIDKEYPDAHDQVPESIDITTGKTSSSVPEGMGFYVSVRGNMMGGVIPYRAGGRPSGGGGGGGPVILPRVSGEDILRINIDSNKNDTTGEFRNGIWVDRIIEVRGKDGVITSKVVKEYDGGWRTLLTDFPIAVHAGEIELTVPNSTLRLGSWSLYFEMTDWSGETDLTSAWLMNTGVEPADANTMITEKDQTDTFSMPEKPSPRYGAMSAVDDTGRIVLFGGRTASGYSDETWVYFPEHNQWRNMNPLTRPSGRVWGAMAYYRSMNVFVLYGGWNTGGGIQDTWTYSIDSNIWSFKSTSGNPGARYEHAMVYDVRADRIILFGGYLSGQKQDTWSFDLSTKTWTNLNPSNPPPARILHAMSYDVKEGASFVFGGYGGVIYRNDVWKYDSHSNAWTNMSLNLVTPSPPARSQHRVAYDSSLNKHILFGGRNSSVSYFGDLWVYDVASRGWVNRTPPRSPMPRRDFSMEWSSYTRTAIIYGGFSGTYNDEMWAYRYDDNRWARLDLSNVTLSRVKSGDLNHDGREEILTVGWIDTIPQYAILRVARWDGVAYTYPAGSTVLYSTGMDSMIMDAAIGDVDTDGEIEIVCAGNMGDDGGVYVLNWSDATPDPGYELEAYATWNHGMKTWVNAVSLADADNDGGVEVITTGSYLSSSKGALIGEAMMFKVQGGHLIPLTHTWLDSAYPVTWSYDLAVSDADSDGMPEVFTGGSRSLFTSNWTSVSPGAGAHPGARYWSAMAYDFMEKKIVLFGGSENGIRRNDTWEYDINTGVWVQTTMDGAPGAPSPRYMHDMVYIGSTGEVLLYGGTTSNGVNSDETWSYNTITHKWTLISSGTPPARRAHRMVYDSVADRVIMFGGIAAVSVDETWEYNPHTKVWRNLFPSVRPSPRYSFGMAFDSVSNKVVVFGGLPGPSGDTWIYDHDTNNWTNRNPASPPEARSNPAMHYDGITKKVILFGGGGGIGAFYNNLWVYDLSQNRWTNITGGFLPGARWVGASAYVTDRWRVYIFGGYNSSGSLDDTWYHRFINSDYEGIARATERVTLSWVEVTQPTRPAPRDYPQMAYDSQSDVVVLFGGRQSSGYLGDTWLFYPSNNTWRQVFPAVSPSARGGGGMVYMTKHDKILLFGGAGSSGYKWDTWLYDVETNTWKVVTTSVHPPGRSGIQYGMVYLEGVDRVILFGGSNVTYYKDVWEYDPNTNTWTQLPDGPSIRGYHAMAPLPGGNEALLYGGWNGGGTYYSDTWRYTYPDGWIMLSPPVSPGPRLIHAMRYDSLSQRCILFGGSPDAVNYRDDTWEFDPVMQTWRQLSPKTAPGARTSPGMVYAQLENRYILFGGFSSGSSKDDTWILSLTPWVESSRVSSGDEVTSLTADDIDHDGATEVIIAEYFFMSGADHPAVHSYEYHNGGFGTMELNDLILSWGLTGRVWDLTAGDIDRDGRWEMIFTGNVTDGHAFVTVMNDTASGGYPGETQYTWVTNAVSRGHGVIASDVDRDGVPEIITAGISIGSEVSGEVRIMNWNIVWPPISELVLEKDSHTSSGSVRIYGVDIGDIDHDGVKEVVEVGYDSGSSPYKAYLRIVSWDGRILSEENSLTWFLTGHTWATDVALADVDSDGVVEIVVSGRNYSGSRWGGFITVLNWSGNAGDNVRFEGNYTWFAVESGVNTYVEDVEVSDVDNDGRREIITSGYVTRSPYYEGQISIVTWDGISFHREFIENTTSSGHTFYWGLEVNDVDADGRDEILAAGYNYSSSYGTWSGYVRCIGWTGVAYGLEFQFWVTRGDGTDTRLEGVTSGDVDSDGVVEIIVTGYYKIGSAQYGLIQTVYRFGGSTYLENYVGWQVSSTDTKGYDVSVGDPDRNGDMEIIVTGQVLTTPASAFLEIWRYPGLTLMYERVWYNVSTTWAYRVVVCDLDDDGTFEMTLTGFYLDGSIYHGSLWIWRLGIPEFTPGGVILVVMMVSGTIPVILRRIQTRKTRRS